MNWFRLKACEKCQGDLVLDNGDWGCLQCGTYYYSGLYRPAGLGPTPQRLPRDLLDGQPPEDNRGQGPEDESKQLAFLLDSSDTFGGGDVPGAREAGHQVEIAGVGVPEANLGIGFGSGRTS